MSGRYGTGKHPVGSDNPDQNSGKDNPNNGGVEYKTGGTHTNRAPLAGGTIKPKKESLT